MRFLTVIIVLLSACKATTYVPRGTDEKQNNPKEIPVSNQPDWVVKKPVSSNAFIGIGNASIRNPDYQAIAKKKALDDLASEISVRIESTSLLHQLERNSDYQARYQASIKSEVKEELVSYELVETWEDGNFYWVQYALSKSDYYAEKNAQIEAAEALAAESYKAGKEATAKGHIVSAAKHYAKAIDYLSEFLHKKNEVIIDGKQVLLALEAHAALIDILTKINTSSSAKDLALSNNGESIPVSVQALYRDVPVSGLPLDFKSGKYLFQKTTNADGKIELRVKSPPFSEKLSIRPNLDFLASSEILDAIIGSTPISEAYITINAEPKTFSIVIADEELSPNRKQILKSLFSNILSSYGAVSEEPQNSAFKVELSAKVREGTEMSGLYSAFLDLEVIIKDDRSNVQYADTFFNIKGLHTSYELAKQRAFQNIDQDHKNEINRSIETNFLNK